MYDELKRAWAELTSAGQMFELQKSDIRGVSTLNYKHAPASLRDVWLASAGHAERDYLVYGDERISYREAHRQVAAVAAAHGLQYSVRSRLQRNVEMRNEFLARRHEFDDFVIEQIGLDA